MLNLHSRISRCGLISQYANDSAQDPAQAWLASGQATFERCHTRAELLLVRHYVKEYQQECFAKMADWIRDGKIKYREDLWSGLERAPQAMTAMLKGGNFGKMLIAVSADPSLNHELAAKRASGNTLA